MNAAERGELKEQLRSLTAGHGNGIDLDSKNRWVIEGLKNPTDFFRQLDKVTPKDSILYFEGCTISREAVELYQKHRALNAVSVIRDTIFPIPETFHVSATPELINSLVGFLNKYERMACFDHVKAYQAGNLIFAFHDAFDGSASCLFSDQIPEDNIKAFAASLAGKYRLESNINHRNPEQLRQFLWLLENPQKLKTNWPWWKKALFFWKQ
jgi:hypothetical protein